MTRAEAAKRFVGLVIDWQARLEAIYPDDDGILATLRFSWGEYKGFPVIQCKVEAHTHPDLKILPEGSVFRLQGPIEKATQFEIWVHDANLTLIKGVFHRG